MVFNSVIVSETAFHVGISCGVSDILVTIFKTDSLLQLVLTHLITVFILKRLVSSFYRFWNSHSMKKRKLGSHRAEIWAKAVWTQSLCF